MSTRRRTAIVAGGTGLVGGHVLHQLVDIRSEVIGLTRRPVKNPVPGVSYSEIDYEALCEGAPLPEADEVYICLGTTIKKAGTREAFNRVDRDYVIAVAEQARAAGAWRLGLVSAIGASTDARVEYSRTKGEVEEAIGNMGYDHVSIVRPGLILGERRNDPRPFEQFASFMTPMFNPLLQGSGRKYRSIDAEVIAAALIASVRANQPGVHILDYDDMVGILE